MKHVYYRMHTSICIFSLLIVCHKININSCNLSFLFCLGMSIDNVHTNKKFSSIILIQNLELIQISRFSNECFSFEIVSLPYGPSVEYVLFKYSLKLVM